MKRERVLKDRRHQFESVLKNQKEMSDWQKRIELDERRLKSDIKRALDNTKRQAAKPSTSSSKASTEGENFAVKRGNENHPFCHLSISTFLSTNVSE